MPRVTTWKVPLTLWLVAWVAKIGLSATVSDPLGSWAGGVLGFLALVTFLLWRPQPGSRPRHGAPPQGQPR